MLIPDIGYLPDEKSGVSDEVRLLYVAMTRATNTLMMTSHRESPLMEKLRLAVGGQ